MKFFKEDNDKSKEVPGLPTGYGSIESCKNGFETIHPSICAFKFPPLLIHFLIIQPFLCCQSAISEIGADIRNNPVRDKCASECLPVKTCIQVTEESVSLDFRSRKLTDDLIYSVIYLEEIGLVPCLRFCHDRRNALIIRKEKCICCASFLSSLIFGIFDSAIYWRMGSIDMGYGKVKTTIKQLL